MKSALWLATVAIPMLLAIAIITAAFAYAQPSPYIPSPPFWCPGNAPGSIATGYGGYCEGRTFPDGTRLNTWRFGYFWQPLRCIIPDGTPNPPLAPPGGCEGLLG